MLKQGIKTISTEFIQTRALSQLSFVQFRPYATSFPGLLSLTLRPPLTVDARLKVIVLFKTNIAEQGICCAHTFCSLNCNFFFSYGLFTLLMTPKRKNRIDKALSKQI